MDELQNLIHDALIEKWPGIKQLPDQVAFKSGEEGIEEILSYNPPWSVSIVQKDTDKLLIELYRNESESELRTSAVDLESIHRVPFQKFWVKDVLNHEDKYLFEYQGAEGGAAFVHWSPSEFCDQIEVAFVNHEKLANI